MFGKRQLETVTDELSLQVSDLASSLRMVAAVVLAVTIAGLCVAVYTAVVVTRA